MTFLNWFFEQLPEYFWKNDSYKDANGEGLLQRYLRAFGQELDEEITPKIDSYLDQVDPLICESQYLNHIAYTLGFPPDLFPNDEEKYRKFLSIVIQIYQIKGTLLAYQTVFGYLGYSVDVIVPDIYGWTYDDGHTYDEDMPGEYDGFCVPCYDYYLGLSALNPSGTGPLCLPLPDSEVYTLDLTGYALPEIIERVLCFLQPINLHLLAVIPTVFICETAGFAYKAKVSGIYREYSMYDDGHIYDEDTPETYDNSNDTEVILATNQIPYPEADNIVLRAIAGENTHLNYLNIYSSGTLLISILVTSIDFPAYNESVYHFKIPNEITLTGINQLRLVSSYGGNFSYVDVDSFDKLAGEDLEILWDLTILNCGDQIDPGDQVFEEGEDLVIGEELDLIVAQDEVVDWEEIVEVGEDLILNAEQVDVEVNLNEGVEIGESLDLTIEGSLALEEGLDAGEELSLITENTIVLEDTINASEELSLTVDELGDYMVFQDGTRILLQNGDRLTPQ